MKTCSMCGQTKSVDEFHRDRSRPEGRQRQCKMCKTAEAARRRQADLAGHAEKQAAWRRTNPDAARAIAARHDRDPQKVAARRAVHKAIRDGELSRPEACESCGLPAKTHAHHDDYTRPLDVQFLCPLCHLAVHGKTARLAVA